MARLRVAYWCLRCGRKKPFDHFTFKSPNPDLRARAVSPLCLMCMARMDWKKESRRIRKLAMEAV